MFTTIVAIAISAFAWAQPIETNAVVIADPPAWLTRTEVESTVARIQRFMEWDIRKVRVIWYHDQAPFLRASGFGAAPAAALDTILAFSRKDDNAIHLGPRVTADNFEAVFRHELVHIIIYQKYGNSIPEWLNEGMANYVSKHGTVDYRWLSSQPARDVTSLQHPFLTAITPFDSRYHYQASQAVMEMLAANCDIHSLLQLSMGQTLQSYLSTLCSIPDLNEAFRNWVKKKAGAASP